ncbi:MAG: ACP S-malonyltransferase [Candidatus Aminicenantes bacterium]|nr:ACP S-malonyltransferase [Candidatus Aminicenantes bacterium]
MNRTVFLFPGQGSQAVGMGLDFQRNSETARTLFARADDVLGYSLSRLCFEGPEEELKLTQNTQPALLVCSVVAFELLELIPDYAAGHSLGEYSALVAAGALSFEDAVLLVHKRGRYMQEAVPVGVGAMAALLGAERRTVLDSLARIGSGTVEVANWNSPEQTVIAGHKPAVEEAVSLIQASRSVFLPVSAPFHTTLMVGAEARLGADLDAVPFHDLRFPVVTNVDARVIRTGGEARDALKRQVSRPVLWLDSMERLKNENVTCFVELGPGRVLSGLMKRIGRGWPGAFSLLNVEDMASLEKTRQAISSRPTA